MAAGEGEVEAAGAVRKWKSANWRKYFRRGRSKDSGCRAGEAGTAHSGAVAAAAPLGEFAALGDTFAERRTSFSDPGAL